jgi:hypothetical protein
MKKGGITEPFEGYDKYLHGNITTHMQRMQQKFLCDKL